MDLKLPVVLFDELSETVIRSSGLLDMASGEITRVDYEDYDIGTQGLPAEQEDYEFTSGMLSNGDRDVEFRVEVNVVAGTYSVTPSELLELKGRAARLFASVPPKGVSAVGRKAH
ncbi:hypothetical protein [Methylibium sp.]|uniref:hypothetical protein n=1 Tax=Methylibium sp. TaxID=2067992 RepID=UPI003D136FD4